jgi:hypothetical protein
MPSAPRAWLVVTALSALAALQTAHADAEPKEKDYDIDDLISMEYQDYADTFALDDLDYAYAFDDFNVGLGGTDDAFNYYNDEIDEYYNTYGFYADGDGDDGLDDYFFGTDGDDTIGDCTMVDGKAELTGAPPRHLCQTHLEYMKMPSGQPVCLQIAGARSLLAPRSACSGRLGQGQPQDGECTACAWPVSDPARATPAGRGQRVHGAIRTGAVITLQPPPGPNLPRSAAGSPH